MAKLALIQVAFWANEPAQTQIGRQTPKTASACGSSAACAARDCSAIEAPSCEGTGDAVVGDTGEGPEAGRIGDANLNRARLWRGYRLDLTKRMPPNQPLSLA